MNAPTEEVVSLEDTIENFHDFILDRNQLIEQEIVGPDQAFKLARLNVYYEGYALRLLENLEKGFVGLKVLLGTEQFQKLGRDYLRSYPSNHFSIRYFGRHFAKFLASHDEVEPLYVEIAQFEWFLQDIIDAKDAPHLTFEDMAALSPDAWGNLILTTHPSFMTTTFFYPTPQIWQATQHTSEEAPSMLREEKPVHWLMWRFNHQSRFLAITDEQLAMIQAIQEGHNFSQVCEKLCEIMDEEQVINFAAQTLRQWITEGLFSEFRVESV